MALAAQQGQRVAQLGVVVVEQRLLRLADKALPQRAVVLLKCSRRVLGDEVVRQRRLPAVFADFADEAGGGFFGQQGFLRRANGNRQQQRQQRVFVGLALRQALPGFAGWLR